MKLEQSDAETEQQRLESLCQELLRACRQNSLESLADMPAILAKIGEQLRRQVWWVRNDKGILEHRKLTPIQEDTLRAYIHIEELFKGTQRATIGQLYKVANELAKRRTPRISYSRSGVANAALSLCLPRRERGPGAPRKRRN